MEEILKKIPISIIALSVMTLTALISYAVLRGDTEIDIWGLEINPRQQRAGSTNESVPIANESVPIGSVIASTLSPDQMKGIHSNSWTLADGKDVATTTQYFQQIGKTKLPDLRGMFIRGMNAGRTDGKQDPDGHNRAVGEFQLSQIEKHHHEIRTAGIWGRSFKGENGEPKTAHELDGSTTDFGGGETRPSNVALYYYIKID